MPCKNSVAVTLRMQGNVSRCSSIHIMSDYSYLSRAKLEKNDFRWVSKQEGNGRCYEKILDVSGNLLRTIELR